MDNVIELPTAKKSIIRSFQAIFRDNPHFHEVTKLCEKMYQECGILEKGQSFSDHPEFYSGIFQNGRPLAILGAFVGNDLVDLPIDKVLIYSKEAGPKIEIGRLAFAKRPQTPAEYEELFRITRELIENYYFLVTQNYKYCYNWYFETHSRIIELLTVVFGSEFMIPINCDVVWENIPSERIGFYEKFRQNKAGLYQVDVSILEESLADGERNYSLAL